MKIWGNQILDVQPHASRVTPVNVNVRPHYYMINGKYNYFTIDFNNDNYKHKEIKSFW